MSLEEAHWRKQQALGQRLFGAVALLALIALASCPNPITKAMVTNVKDETSPVRANAHENARQEVGATAGVNFLSY